MYKYEKKRFTGHETGKFAIDHECNFRKGNGFPYRIIRDHRLSPSTVSSLTSELIEKGWIVENGVATSTGGRKRIELSVNNSKGYIAILEIGWRRAVLHF